IKLMVCRIVSHTIKTSIQDRKRTVMPKRILLFCMLFILLIPVNGVFARDVPLGAEINLLTSTPRGFAPNTVFHIKHGFIEQFTRTNPSSAYDFELYVDGVLLNESFVSITNAADGSSRTAITWVYNFPSGLPGEEHFFVGRWYGPCSEYAANPKLCSSPTESILAFEKELSVKFTN
ncbi:MAG: hypothetical protein AAF846_25410, partial [Chloroflexota bacterium]